MPGSCFLVRGAEDKAPLSACGVCLFCRFSDAVILFKNDTLSKLCSGNAGVGVTYKSMNRYVADCLTGITLPTDTLTPSRYARWDGACH